MKAIKAMQFVLVFGVASGLGAGCSKQAPPEAGQPARTEQPVLTQDRPSGQTDDRPLDMSSTGPSSGGSSYTGGSNTGGSITMERPGGGPPIILPVPTLNGTLSGIPTAPKLTIVQPAPITAAPAAERAIPALPVRP